jgi:hypothetical protein
MEFFKTLSSRTTVFIRYFSHFHYHSFATCSACHLFLIDFESTNVNYKYHSNKWRMFIHMLVSTIEFCFGHTHKHTLHAHTTVRNPTYDFHHGLLMSCWMERETFDKSRHIPSHYRSGTYENIIIRFGFIYMLQLYTDVLNGFYCF